MDGKRIIYLIYVSIEFMDFEERMSNVLIQQLACNFDVIDCD